jgi:hypothetical protein
MRLHPELTEFKKAKHIKAFNKILKKMEKDLKKLGSPAFDATITAAGSPRSLLRRFFDPGYGDLEEVLTVLTQVYQCPVEIAVPMGKAGIALPFMMHIILPVPIRGRAEYRRGRFRSKWHLAPEDKGRIADLKRTLPKVKVKQNQISKKVPVQVEWKVEVPYFLGPTGDGRTEWIVHAGYEGGMLTGGNRPPVVKYLKAIPAVWLHPRPGLLHRNAVKCRAKPTTGGTPTRSCQPTRAPCPRTSVPAHTDVPPSPPSAQME